MGILYTRDGISEVGNPYMISREQGRTQVGVRRRCTLRSWKRLLLSGLVEGLWTKVIKEKKRENGEKGEISDLFSKKKFNLEGKGGGNFG